jgi:hypothetical protein
MFYLLWNYPLFFYGILISTNYENNTLNFVVLSIALSRQDASFTRRRRNITYKKCLKT